MSISPKLQKIIENGPNVIPLKQRDNDYLDAFGPNHMGCRKDGKNDIEGLTDNVEFQNIPDVQHVVMRGNTVNIAAYNVDRLGVDWVVGTNQAPLSAATKMVYPEHIVDPKQRLELQKNRAEAFGRFLYINDVHAVAIQELTFKTETAKEVIPILRRHLAGWSCQPDIFLDAIYTMALDGSDQNCVICWENKWDENGFSYTLQRHSNMWVFDDERKRDRVDNRDEDDRFSLTKFGNDLIPEPDQKSGLRDSTTLAADHQHRLVCVGLKFEKTVQIHKGKGAKEKDVEVHTLTEKAVFCSIHGKMTNRPVNNPRERKKQNHLTTYNVESYKAAGKRCLKAGHHPRATDANLFISLNLMGDFNKDGAEKVKYNLVGQKAYGKSKFQANIAEIDGIVHTSDSPYRKLPYKWPHGGLSVDRVSDHKPVLFSMLMHSVYNSVKQHNLEECNQDQQDRLVKLINELNLWDIPYTTSKLSDPADSAVTDVDDGSSGQKSGQKSGKKSGQKSGKKSGKNSGKKSGKNSGTNGGKNGGKNSGKSSDKSGGKKGKKKDKLQRELQRKLQRKANNPGYTLSQEQIDQLDSFSKEKRKFRTGDDQEHQTGTRYILIEDDSKNDDIHDGKLPMLSEIPVYNEGSRKEAQKYRIPNLRSLVNRINVLLSRTQQRTTTEIENNELLVYYEVAAFWLLCRPETMLEFTLEPRWFDLGEETMASVEAKTAPQILYPQTYVGGYQQIDDAQLQVGRRHERSEQRQTIEFNKTDLVIVGCLVLATMLCNLIVSCSHWCCWSIKSALSLGSSITNSLRQEDSDEVADEHPIRDVKLHDEIERLV